MMLPNVREGRQLPPPCRVTALQQPPSPHTLPGPKIQPLPAENDWFTEIPEIGIPQN